MIIWQRKASVIYYLGSNNKWQKVEQEEGMLIKNNIYSRKKTNLNLDKTNQYKWIQPILFREAIQYANRIIPEAC